MVSDDYKIFFSRFVNCFLYIFLVCVQSQSRDNLIQVGNQIGSTTSLTQGGVPTLHIPNKKILIEKAFKDSGFMVNTKIDAAKSFYPC
jgi:hypothetical protein